MNSTTNKGYEKLLLIILSIALGLFILPRILALLTQLLIVLVLSSILAITVILILRLAGIKVDGAAISSWIRKLIRPE